MTARNEALYTDSAKIARRQQARDARGPIYRLIDDTFHPLGYAREDGLLDIRRLAEDTGHSNTSFYAMICRDRISARMVSKLSDLHQAIKGEPMKLETFLPHMVR